MLFSVHRYFKTCRKVIPVLNFQWGKLEMSSVEKRRLLCSTMFHVVAITSVVWSLSVLTERMAEEMRSGLLEWPFWTKLIVVAIGFTGGCIFMYVQCMICVAFFRHWRGFRIICVQNAPKKGQQQQQKTVFSAAAQLTASVLANEENSLLPGEDKFHSCQSGSSNSVNEPVDPKDSERTTPAAAETGSMKTTLMSVTDSLVPASDHHPLSEVVVVSSLEDPVAPVACTGHEAAPVPFLSRQMQQTAS